MPLGFSGRYAVGPINSEREFVMHEGFQIALAQKPVRVRTEVKRNSGKGFAELGKDFWGHTLRTVKERNRMKAMAFNPVGLHLIRLGIGRQWSSRGFATHVRSFS
jgi:hypothetical protein